MLCVCVLERKTETELTTVGASRLIYVGMQHWHLRIFFLHLGLCWGTQFCFTQNLGLKATKVSGYEEYEELPEEEDELGKRPERRRLGGKGVVQLNFPLVPVVPCNDTFLLSEALGGVAIKWAGETSLGDYLVELSNK